MNGVQVPRNVMLRWYTQLTSSGYTSFRPLLTFILPLPLSPSFLFPSTIPTLRHSFAIYVPTKTFYFFLCVSAVSFPLQLSSITPPLYHTISHSISSFRVIYRSEWAYIEALFIPFIFLVFDPCFTTKQHCTVYRKKVWVIASSTRITCSDSKGTSTHLPTSPTLSNSSYISNLETLLGRALCFVFTYVSPSTSEATFSWKQSARCRPGMR